MPQIATSQRQVKKEVLSTPQRSVSGPNVAMGKPLEFQVGGAIAQAGNIIVEERLKAEKIELDAFKTKLRDKQNSLMHDPQGGFKTVRGKDTLEQTDKYEEEYSKFVKSEVDGFKSDRLKEMAGQMAEEGRVGLTNQFMQHTSRQLEAHDDAQTEANIKSIRDTAILNYQDDPGRISESVKEQTTLIKDFADRKGMSKKQKDMMVQEASSNLHKGVISQMITNDQDLLADSYFKEAKAAGQLTGQDALAIEKGIEQASLLGDAQRVTNVVMSQEDMSRTDALAFARDKYRADPKKQKATSEMINRRYDEKKRIESENQVKMFEGLSVGMEKGRKIEDVKKDPQWGTITHNQRKALEADARHKAKGTTPTTDLIAYENLAMMAAVPETRDKFLKTSISEYKHKLSPSDYKKFVDMKKAMLKGDTSEAEGFLSRGQVATSVMQQMNIDSDDDKAQYKLKLEQRAREWSEQNGNRKIPTDELQKLANKLAGDVVLSEGVIYDTTEKIYKVTPAQVQEMQASDVPSKDYEQIQKSLFARKVKHPAIEVTAETILNEYKLTKGLR